MQSISNYTTYIQPFTVDIEKLWCQLKPTEEAHNFLQVKIQKPVTYLKHLYMTYLQYSCMYILSNSILCFNVLNRIIRNFWYMAQSNLGNLRNIVKWDHRNKLITTTFFFLKADILENYNLTRMQAQFGTNTCTTHTLFRWSCKHLIHSNK